MDPQALLARLKALGANFTTGQLISLVLSFVLVVAIVGGSALWLNTPTYTLLFADMDQEAAGQVVTRLRDSNVPFTLDEGGTAIRVPSDQVDELRLELTSQGLPSSGRVGFEIFDRTAFGATEFLEQVNYRRALEGEIARTIATLTEVSAARVHIAMGQDSLFGEKRPAKASVVLKLGGTRGLAPGTVTGIANLVAASVEGLRPEAVVILDSTGRPLSRPTEDDVMGAGQVERQQRLENDMSTRLVALLEPVVGEGRVRVNVALALNPRSREVTEDRWDPNTVIRSQQTSSDLSGTDPAVGGIAGARGNLPVPAAPTSNATTTPPATAAGQAATAQAVAAAIPNPIPSGSSRQTQTTNYEVSRTTSRTVEPPGDVARISVAVIVDHSHQTQTDEAGNQTVNRVARQADELQKLEALVSASVGLDANRGDVVTVENVPFDEPAAGELEEPSFWTRNTPTFLDVGRTLAVLILGLTALIFIVRPMTQRTGGGLVAKAAGGVGAVSVDRPRTVAELENELEMQMDAALADKVGEGRRLPVLARRVATMAQKEPEHTAKLLRSLMAEQER